MNEIKAREDRPQIRQGRREPTLRPAPRWRRVAGISLVVLAVVGLAWWIHARPAPAPRAARFATSGAVPVVAASIQAGDINVTLSELGTVTPLATVTVRTQINGQLMRIHFQEGQRIKQGDLLAEIDSRPYELARAQAQGQLQRDQAQLKDAELNLERYRTLVKQDSIARQQMDTQQALVGQLQGAVKTDQAQIDTANLNIAYCHIVSPVTGRVGLRLVDQGNYVQISDTSGLAVVTQLQPITVVFTVPEDNLPAILKRLHAGATLPVTVYDRGQTAKLATGQLLAMDSQIDTTTGTVKFKAQFDNEDESLFPNQFVNAALLVDVLRDATVAPTAAILRGAPGTFVYVINADDIVTARPVKLGPTDGDRVAVLSGLAAGDRVVVDGADKLRDGSKIALRQPPGAQPTVRAGGGGAAAEGGGPGAPTGGGAGAAEGATAPPGGAADQPRDQPGRRGNSQ